MADKKNKYSDLFHSPDDGEFYTGYDDGDVMGYGEIAPFLMIHKDSGDNLSTPRRMARLNGYYDATERGDNGSYLKDYSGVRFDVDMRTRKDKENGKKVKSKDYTNVYLKAYKRALKNPEVYGESYRDTGSDLGNLISATRRFLTPNTISDDIVDEAKGFTKSYIDARNEWGGYEPTSQSVNAYNRTPVIRKGIGEELNYIKNNDSKNWATTYDRIYNSKHPSMVFYPAVIKVPGRMRLQIGRTGNLATLGQCGVLEHEFNHAAETTGLSNAPKVSHYQEDFKNLPRNSEGLSWSSDYDTSTSPKELRSEAVAVRKIYGIDPEKRFSDLSVYDQCRIVDYLTERFNLDKKKFANLDLWFDILDNEDNNFRDGGRLGRLKRLFGF